MSKRLQVLIDEEEYREIKETARRQGLSVSEWVRRSLREARSGEPVAEPSRKLEAVRSAAGHRFPTADIEQMLREVEDGYLGDPA